jgi:magnesium chelatase family protein
MDLTLPPPAEGTAEAAARVQAARAIQTERYGVPETSNRRPVNTDAAARHNLSARAYHRVLKVARTIADLDGAGSVRRIHIAEALSYRRRNPSEKPGVTANALAQ